MLEKLKPSSFPKLYCPFCGGSKLKLEEAASLISPKKVKKGDIETVNFEATGWCKDCVTRFEMALIHSQKRLE